MPPDVGVVRENDGIRMIGQAWASSQQRFVRPGVPRSRAQYAQGFVERDDIGKRIPNILIIVPDGGFTGHVVII